MSRAEQDERAAHGLLSIFSEARERAILSHHPLAGHMESILNIVRERCSEVYRGVSNYENTLENIRHDICALGKEYLELFKQVIEFGEILPDSRSPADIEFDKWADDWRQTIRSLR